MKSLIIFFEKLTFGKKVALLTAPVLTLLISMKLLIIGLWLLVFFDLLTGIRKNLHISGISFNPFKKAFWKAIKSYLLRRTWKKTYEYGMGIIVIAVLESLILGGTPITILAKTFSLTELSIVIPALVEVWSIGENLEAISGRNFLKSLLPLMPKPIRVLFSKKEKR